jgi:hypothetical protein
MTNLKDYTSTITLVFEGNSHEAESIEDYIQKIKEVFYQEFNIQLADSEITNIQEMQDV